MVQSKFTNHDTGLQFEVEGTESVQYPVKLNVNGEEIMLDRDAVKNLMSALMVSMNETRESDVKLDKYERPYLMGKSREEESIEKMLVTRAANRELRERSL